MCIFRYYCEYTNGFTSPHCEILCVFSDTSVSVLMGSKVLTVRFCIFLGTTVSVLMGSKVLTVRFCVYFQVLL